MELKANLTVSIRKQGGRFVAYSPALDISTSGKTEAQAKKRFIELVNLFVEELEEAGTTADVLRELGWTKAGSGTRNWMPPTYKTQKIPLRIPLTV